MLNLFNDGTLTIQKLQSISRTKINGINPSFFRYPKWVCRCSCYVLTIYFDMNKVIGFSYKCINNHF